MLTVSSIEDRCPSNIIVVCLRDKFCIQMDVEVGAGKACLRWRMYVQFWRKRCRLVAGRKRGEGCLKNFNWNYLINATTPRQDADTCCTNVNVPPVVDITAVTRRRCTWNIFFGMFSSKFLSRFSLYFHFPPYLILLLSCCNIIREFSTPLLFHIADV